MHTGLPEVSGRGANGPPPSRKPGIRSVGGESSTSPPEGCKARGQHEFVDVVDGYHAGISHQGQAQFHHGVPRRILPLARFQPKEIGFVQATVLGQSVPAFSRLEPQSPQGSTKLCIPIHQHFTPALRAAHRSASPPNVQPLIHGPGEAIDDSRRPLYPSGCAASGRPGLLPPTPIPRPVFSFSTPPSVPPVSEIVLWVYHERVAR